MDAFNNYHMGVTAENIASKLKIQEMNRMILWTLQSSNKFRKEEIW